MNAGDIESLQKVSGLYSRRHMFEMTQRRESVIRERMDRIAQRELESEDNETIDKLVALGY